jgi:ribosomal protein L37E
LGDKINPNLQKQLLMKTCEKCGMDNTDRATYCSHCGYEFPDSTTKEIRPMIPAQKKKRYSLIAILVALIAFMAVNYFSSSLFSPSIDKQLMKAAGEVNESCPIMVDNMTRLDNTIAIPPRIFRYNYTLLDLAEKSIDLEALKREMEPNIINSVHTNPDTQVFRDNDVTLEYYYRDEELNHLFTIVITPEQYK